MAGRSSYIVAHPNNEDHITELKSGKVPAWAVWCIKNGEWVFTGWTFKTDKMEALKAARNNRRPYGWTESQVTITRVLPASL